jgi:hypothetical protein
VKVLVITSEPIGADDLRSALGAAAADDAEVLVVAPALHASPLRFWLSDADQAIAEAQGVQRESVGHLDDAGISASGDTGEADTLAAVQDSLRTFRAERIVIFSHPPGDRDYKESVGTAEVEERFGLPVTQHATPG